MITEAGCKSYRFAGWTYDIVAGNMTAMLKSISYKG